MSPDTAAPHRLAPQLPQPWSISTHMTSTVIVAVITSAIGGGLVGEILRYLTDQRSNDQTAKTESRRLSITEFDTLNKRCLAEVARLAAQVHDLEATVVALSRELERLGGDPFAIRAALHTNRVPHQQGDSPDASKL